MNWALHQVTHWFVSLSPHSIKKRASFASPLFCHGFPCCCWLRVGGRTDRLGCCQIFYHSPNGKLPTNGCCSFFFFSSIKNSFSDHNPFLHNHYSSSFCHPMGLDILRSKVLDATIFRGVCSSFLLLHTHRVPVPCSGDLISRRVFSNCMVRWQGMEREDLWLHLCTFCVTSHG